MTVAAIVAIGILGVPISAGAAWLCHAARHEWTPRQRVFNCAAIVPSIIAVGAAAFAVVIVTLAPPGAAGGARNFLIQALIAVLATLNFGMVAAFAVELVRGR